MLKRIQTVKQSQGIKSYQELVHQLSCKWLSAFFLFFLSGLSSDFSSGNLLTHRYEWLLQFYNIFFIFGAITVHLLNMSRIPMLYKNPSELPLGDFDTVSCISLSFFLKLSDFSIADAQIPNVADLINVFRSFRHLGFQNNSYPLAQSKHSEAMQKWVSQSHKGGTNWCYF